MLKMEDTYYMPLLVLIFTLVGLEQMSCLKGHLTWPTIYDDRHTTEGWPGGGGGGSMSISWPLGNVLKASRAVRQSELKVHLTVQFLMQRLVQLIMQRMIAITMSLYSLFSGILIASMTFRRFYSFLLQSIQTKLNI